LSGSDRKAANYCHPIEFPFLTGYRPRLNQISHAGTAGGLGNPPLGLFRLHPANDGSRAAKLTVNPKISKPRTTAAFG